MRGSRTGWSELFRSRDPSVDRARLRAYLASPAGWPLVAPSVFDAMSARVAEQCEFDTVVVSGYGVSFSRLGLPDAGFLAVETVTDVVKAIVSRTGLAVIADCDTGYGNAIGVMRTVEEMIIAGATAIIIEDQASPKRCGHVAGKELIGAEEFATKLRAADEVRRNLAPDLVLIARCDARGVAEGTVDETIRRGVMYRQAGADVIFPEGLLSHAELQKCSRGIDAPLLYNTAGVSPVLTSRDLALARVAIVIAGNAMRATLAALQEYFAQLRGEGPPFLMNAPSVDVHTVSGFPELMQWEKVFMSAEELDRRYDGSIGFGAMLDERQS